MINIADQQIGQVLSTVVPGFSAANGNPSDGPAIIFLSDHGEYALSHGLHAKGGAVYEEALRVPLYVVMPGQSAPVLMPQMCSMVDVFRLVVELSNKGVYDWASDGTYLDQAANQSLYSFILDPSLAETRYFTGSDSNQYVYVLTTTDETYIDNQPYNGSKNIDCLLRNHVMCIRTKSYDDTSNPYSAFTGGKLAIYSKWVYPPPLNIAAPIVDGSNYSAQDPTWIMQDYEYYDYENYNNRTELLNDYVSALNSVNEHGSSTNGAAAHALLTDMLTAFGNMQARSGARIIQEASGLVATMLTRQLQGSYNSQPLSQATTTALEVWYGWAYGVDELGAVCTF
jgi:hypothetical protein